MKNGTTVADYLTDPSLEVETKAFLKALNTSGGKPQPIPILPGKQRKAGTS